jgi:hypothetical protein
VIYVIGERLGTGRSRKRLAELIGVPEETMMEHVCWVNLWDVPGNIPAYEVSMIEQAAQHDDAIVLLGREVAEAVSLGDQDPLSRIERNGGVGPVLLLLPHPSGLNRWYNDAANTARAQEALHDVWAWFS